jgi:hypothetical protein
MKGRLLGVEKMQDSRGIEARIYEIGPYHFGAEYVDSAGEEIWSSSEHVGMKFEQAWQEISYQLRLRVE